MRSSGLVWDEHASENRNQQRLGVPSAYVLLAWKVEGARIAEKENGAKKMSWTGYWGLEEATKEPLCELRDSSEF